MLTSLRASKWMSLRGMVPRVVACGRQVRLRAIFFLPTSGHCAWAVRAVEGADLGGTAVNGETYR